MRNSLRGDVIINFLRSKMENHSLFNSQRNRVKVTPLGRSLLSNLDIQVEKENKSFRKPNEGRRTKQNKIKVVSGHTIRDQTMEPLTNTKKAQKNYVKWRFFQNNIKSFIQDKMKSEEEERNSSYDWGESTLVCRKQIYEIVGKCREAQIARNERLGNRVRTIYSEKYAKRDQVPKRGMIRNKKLCRDQLRQPEQIFRIDPL